VLSLGGRARLAKVNIEQDASLAAKWGISGIPAVKVFKDGEIIGEFVGALPESEIRRRLLAVLPSKADELVAQADELAAKGDSAEAETRYREALAIDSWPGEITRRPRSWFRRPPWRCLRTQKWRHFWAVYGSSSIALRMEVPRSVGASKPKTPRT